jgi:phosphoglycolate phosphatase-like HAD superfamily hydrolase
MKPHPHIVGLALRITATDPADAVLVGDSVSDIDVARAAGVRSIGYAKNPRRGAELRAAGADAITDSMSDLFALSRKDEED